jgi:hypothetical protein
MPLFGQKSVMGDSRHTPPISGHFEIFHSLREIDLSTAGMGQQAPKFKIAATCPASAASLDNFIASAWSGGPENPPARAFAKLNIPNGLLQSATL